MIQKTQQALKIYLYKKWPEFNAFRHRACQWIQEGPGNSIPIEDKKVERASAGQEFWCHQNRGNNWATGIKSLSRGETLERNNELRNVFKSGLEVRKRKRSNKEQQEQWRIKQVKRGENQVMATMSRDQLEWGWENPLDLAMRLPGDLQKALMV